MQNRRKRSKALSLLLVAALALTVAGCTENTGPSSAGQTSQSGSEEQGVSGHIVLYTSEPQDLVTDMMEDFVSYYPDVTYEIYRSGTGAVTSKIDAELESGATQADVIWFADIGYIYQLDEKGLIEHYIPDGVEKIDAKFNYNNGMAVEVRQIFNVIAYNTRKNTVEITDWDDLTDPGLSGKFAMADPNYSGGAFTTLIGLIREQNIGWDYFEALKANNMKFEQSNGNLQTKVASGEYVAVSVVDFMVRNAKNEGSPVETVWPESGAIMVPTPAAILSTVEKENLDACKAFMDYLLSEAGQKFFVAQGYIPVNATVGVPEGAPSVDEIKTIELDMDYFINHASEARQQFTMMFEN